MKLRLPDSVASAQDLTALQLELHDYAKWFAHEAIKQRVSTKHVSAEPVLSPATSELLSLWANKKTLSQQSLDTLIKTLEEYRSSAPAITLTLAAPPTSSVKATLVGWCRQNIAPNVLISFQFNATLLGGMVVRYGSRVFDWSFRRQILSAREKIPEVLRRV
jgi:F0F1-type ATP synthase delta subunit